MAHTFSCLHYHVVFSTSGRRNLIPQDVLARLCAYIEGVVRNIGGTSLGVGGTTNHLHILISLSPDMPVSKAVNLVKSNSSKWAHETFPTMADFAWQKGYSAFTVSRSGIKAVQQYIENQKSKHRELRFDDELLLLLRKHDIRYDEAKVLDRD